MNTRSKSRDVGRHEIEDTQAQGISEEARNERAWFKREISQLRQELKDTKEKCNTLSGQFLSIESERNLLLTKIEDMQKKNDVDHARIAGLVNARDKEIGRLVSAKSALRSDYQDLMENKVALDDEIETYRKLLERAEKRLSGFGQPEELIQEKGGERVARCVIL